MLTLCVSSNDTSRQEQVHYFLSPSEETVLGRAPECQIVLDPNRYSTVSRHHAKVRMLANSSQPAWEICNLSATNGTYINGKQIEGCQILQPGDRITLRSNGHEFLFEYQSLQATVVIQPPAPPASSSVEPQLDAEASLPPLCGYSWQVGAISISPEGQVLASGSQDKTIKLWQPWCSNVIDLFW